MTGGWLSSHPIFASTDPEIFFPVVTSNREKCSGQVTIFPWSIPMAEGAVLVAAPVFDHKEFPADIRDTQLFSLGFDVFCGPGGYLAYPCNFDLLSPV